MNIWQFYVKAARVLSSSIIRDIPTLLLTAYQRDITTILSATVQSTLRNFSAFADLWAVPYKREAIVICARGKKKVPGNAGACNFARRGFRLLSRCYECSAQLPKGLNKHYYSELRYFIQPDVSPWRNFSGKEEFLWTGAQTCRITPRFPCF